MARPDPPRACHRRFADRPQAHCHAPDSPGHRTPGHRTPRANGPGHRTDPRRPVGAGPWGAARTEGPPDDSVPGTFPVPGTTAWCSGRYLTSRPENETDGVHLVPEPGLEQFTATTTGWSGFMWIGTM